MTDVELDCAPEDARRVVKVALDETPSVTEYTVKGDVITARTAGGTTSFGELVFVELPEADAESETTRVSVTADRRYGFNVTANPWKSKSEVLNGIRTVRDAEPGTLPAGGEKEAVADDGADQPGEGPVEPDLLHATARVLLVMLVGLVLLGGFVVAVLLLL